MRMKHKQCRGHVAAALAAAAALWMAGPSHASESSGVYALTISNTNGGQNFSPPVIALHAQAYRLFELGQPATVELWRLAEDGSTAEFEALDHPELRGDADLPLSRGWSGRELGMLTITRLH